MLSAVVALPSAASVSVTHRGWFGQVQAVVGALWDAYAEIAVYIEVLRVEAGLPAPPNFKGGAWLVLLWTLHCSSHLANKVNRP